MGESFYSLVNPAQEMTAESMTIHHLNPRDLEAAPRLQDVLPLICGRLSEGVLLVHCAMVDVPFPRRACAGEGLPWPRPQVVDTMRLLARRPGSEPRPPVALAGARAHFGLPPHRSHHAMSDAMATAELFLMLRAPAEGAQAAQPAVRPSGPCWQGRRRAQVTVIENGYRGRAGSERGWRRSG